MRLPSIALISFVSLAACDYDKAHLTAGDSNAEEGLIGPNEPGFDNVARCSDPKLVWKTGAKTMYESYPLPGSDECVKFSGCEWEGLFSGCTAKKTEAWVSARNIVAVFPDFGQLQMHDLCLRQGNKIIVATVYDECADSDCEGCCTEHQRDRDQLIDVEKFTEKRWGVLKDGDVEWADLGPTRGGACLDK